MSRRSTITERSKAISFRQFTRATTLPLHAGETLLPSLRNLSIVFRTYSPLAGGFLTKTRQQIADGAGRFNDDVYIGVYNHMFVKPACLDALDKWRTVAESEGCSIADLAYRWVSCHSLLDKELGDRPLVGADSLRRLEET
jgi:aflatoxin B1 aldehyde reductase